MKKPYSFIFHIDFDSFFVSALRTIYPELNNKPVAIAKSSVHAVAESISYELRKLGFKAGQKIYEIKKLEPKTIVVESRYDVYNTISTEIFNYLKTKYSSNLEIASIDECYIFFNYKTLQSEQQALDLAKQIQSQVLKKFKIPISIGISTTKFYAKMTTNISKPFGIGLTNKDNYKERFFDLDIIKFHGIGDKLAQKLNKIGIYKIKDFYNFDLSNFLLKSVLGTTAYKYYDALNIDFQDKINQEDQLKGIGNEVSFANASNDENLIYNALDEMVKKVASRLKHYEKVGNNISLVIRIPTKNWVSKNMQLDYNLSSYQDIKKHAYYLYQQHFADKEILGIGVRISGLLESYNNYQKISLFDKNSKKLSQVDMIISKLKHKTKTNKIYTLSDYQKVKNRKNRFGNDPLGSVIFKKIEVKMKIGIYGGSFDPIHKGHIKLANYVINELQLDKLLIVPNYSSPFKHKTISPQDKVNMINLVLEVKMELCDFEIKRNSTSYTIDTVKYLKNKYPNDELYLIIGSDNLVKLDKWKDIDLISKLTKIVCLKRTNKINKLNLKKYQGILLNNPIYDYSSTDYKKGYLDLVDLKVANYIQANGLYLEKIIHNSLTALRAKHSMACGAFAAELAKAHGYDAKKAYLAGIMHDIAKEWSEQASREFLAEYAPEYANVPKHFLHQHCSAMWAKHGYLLKDQEIIDAINCHTEMKEEMKALDKILFIADKICQGRKFPGIQKVRQLCFEDLEQGFAKVVKITYQLNISKGVIFSNESLKLYQKHMEK